MENKYNEVEGEREVERQISAAFALCNAKTTLRPACPVALVIRKDRPR